MRMRTLYNCFKPSKGVLIGCIIIDGLRVFLPCFIACFMYYFKNFRVYYQ